MDLKSITVSDEQEKYIRENHSHMYPSEIARNLNLSLMKVQRNIEVMGLVPRSKTRQRRKIEKLKPGMFCFKNNEGWLII